MTGVQLNAQEKVRKCTESRQFCETTQHQESNALMHQHGLLWQGTGKGCYLWANWSWTKNLFARSKIKLNIFAVEYTKPIDLFRSSQF